MNSEEKFKKDLNDLLGSKEFPFDELEWGKTSAMLDAKKRKKRIAYILFTGLLFVLGGAFFIYLPSANEAVAIAEKTNINETEINNNLPTKSKNTELPLNSAIAPKTNVNTQINLKSKQTNNNPPVASTTKTKKQNSKFPDDNNPPKTKPTHVAPINLKSDKQTPTKKQGNTAETLTLPIGVAHTHDPKNENSDIVKTPDVFVEEKLNDGIQPIGLGAPTETNATKTSQDQQSETPLTTVDSISQQQNVTVALKTNNNASVDSMHTEAVVAKPDTDYVKRKRPEITLETGTSYLFGWKTTEGRDARGFNAILGFNYMHNLASDLKLGIGFHYSAVGHLKYSSYTSKVTRLDLGEISQVTLFTPQKMHYVWMPIKIHYAINEKSVIGAGITLGYLLTMDSKVERFGQSIQGQSNYQVTKEKGYTQGFNEVDAQFSVFFQHKIFGRFYGNGEFVYGVRDIKNGEILTSESFERNFGFKFTLLFKLFDN